MDGVYSMGSHIVYNSVLELYVGKWLKSNCQEEYDSIKLQLIKYSYFTFLNLLNIFYT